MSRNKKSKVDIDVRVKGLKDLNELKRILPSLITDFEKLANSIDKYNASQDRKSSINLTSSKAKISDRISGLDLGVSKGSIANVKALTANYASLIAQIRRLQKEGGNTNAIELRAIKTYEKLKKEMRDRIELQKRLEQSIKVQGTSEEKLVNEMNRVSEAIVKTGQRAKRGAKEIDEAAKINKQAGFLFLNMGYLIQDSPYGFRGIANNISSSAQAFAYLRSELVEYNKAASDSGKETITLGKALKSAVMSPTGGILLAGSVIPALGELWSTHGDKIKEWLKEISGAAKRSKVELEDYLSVIKEITDFNLESAGFFAGDDVGGIRRLQGERLAQEASMKRFVLLEKELDILNEMQSRLFSIILWRSELEFITPETEKARDAIMEEIKAQEAVIEKLKEKYALQGYSEKEIRKLYKEQKEELDRILQLIQNAQTSLEEFDFGVGELRNELSTELDLVFRDIDFFSRDVSFNEEELEKHVKKAEALLKEYQGIANEILLSGARGSRERAEEYFRIAQKYYEKIKEIRGDNEEDEAEYNDWMYKYNLYQYKRRISDAQNYEERVAAIRLVARAKEEELEVRIKKGVIEDDAQIALERLEIHNEMWDSLLEVERSYIENRNSLKDLYFESDINNDISLSSRLDAVKEYYDRQRDFIHKFYNDTEERELRLTQIEKEEAEKRKQVKEDYWGVVTEIAGYSLTSMMNIMEIVSNKEEANDRRRFEINKLASASRAFISTKEAVMKAYSQGGVFATPSAIAIGLAGATNIAAILSAKYEGGGNSMSGSGQNIAYRGFDLTDRFDAGTGSFENPMPYPGASFSSTPNFRNVFSIPDKVQAEFTDGFGNVVSSGTIQLQRENREDLGYWS